MILETVNFFNQNLGETFLLCSPVELHSVPQDPDGICQRVLPGQRAEKALVLAEFWPGHLWGQGSPGGYSQQNITTFWGNIGGNSPEVTRVLKVLKANINTFNLIQYSTWSWHSTGFICAIHDSPNRICPIILDQLELLGQSQGQAIIKHAAVI